MAVFAHKKESGESPENGHLLEEHLRATASLAAIFAAHFNGGDWARLAGLWHDLGKHAPDWQEFLRLAGEDEAHRARGPDHSSAGAIHAVERFGGIGRVLAYPIAGHHAGLADWHGGMAALSQRLAGRDNLARALSGGPADDLLAAPLPAGGPPARTADPAFWIRMLFSCLVDADFLDTESFMDPDSAARRGGYPRLTELWNRYEEAMAAKRAAAAASDVNAIRHAIWTRCMAAADHAPALFTLTVPTGGGKTLASIGFALKHALAHGKRRIIHVIPYTSIIEQTADVLRGIFGDAVIEHHSNLDAADPERAGTRQRLAAENWDAPVIVTTNVQFFESLFAARPSRCRKLHNIVNSVVIFDEVQLLPCGFLDPILFSIRELHRHYGVSFLLTTATQPAFAPFRTPDGAFAGLENLVEIMPDPTALHRELKRVTVETPTDPAAPVTWEALAAELLEHETVLCVTHRRDDCRLLHRLMPPDTHHLSAAMCGAHRSEVIARLKADLAAGRPTRVVSTQLVEAGVDLDFPVVYRALAGLDSLAQAAGRCNREGRLPAAGRFRIFVPPTRPPRELAAAAEITRRLLARRPDDPFAPERFQEYFRELFWLAGARRDEHGILAELAGREPGDYNFRTAAEKFRLIDDRSRSILVRHGEGAELIDLLKRTGPAPRLLRRLQRYVVNIPEWRFESLERRGGIVESPAAGIWIQAEDGLYDPATGFRGADEHLAYNPDDLII